jgi:catechol 2,3-dioxygenase-like lactoylglutathione lyase family enzyme
VSVQVTRAVPVTRVSELVLEVDDLGRSLAFYRDILGFTVIRGSELRAWLLAGGTTRIGLWTRELGAGIANGRGGRHVHHAFHLAESDFDATVSYLQAHGLHVEVHESRDEGRGRAVYVADPDGNVVELWTLDVSTETEVRP